MFKRFIAATALLVICITPVTAGAGSNVAHPDMASSLNQNILHVTLFPQADSTTAVAMVQVEIPQNVTLPTTVRVPLIPGAQAGWTGEVGTTQGDIERTATQKTGTYGAYLEFEVKESHTAQVDFSGIAITHDGKSTKTGLNWQQTVGAGTTTFDVRVPAGATNIKIDPQPQGSHESNDEGERLYTLPSMNLKGGETLHVGLSYTPAKTGLPTALIVVLVIAAVVLVIAALFLVRQLAARSRQKEV